MTVIWGIVGMLVGVIIAAQLVWPELNLGFLHFGRLRPLHTNAVIFAFGGCALVCNVLLVRSAHLPRPPLGWSAGGLYLLGLANRHPAGRDHAAAGYHPGQGIRRTGVADRHPDHAGLGFLRIVFFGTIAKRKVSHIYVANWFFGGFILAVALLHMVNSAAIPVSLTKSYSAYAGVQDAMIQWWYGHNAVGFFLTAGFLGMMYYFVPKQAGVRCIPTACPWCTSGR
jgi:cytochrome c oxidase cbb3-type subunit 1